MYFNPQMEQRTQLFVNAVLKSLPKIEVQSVVRNLCHRCEKLRNARKKKRRYKTNRLSSVKKILGSHEKWRMVKAIGNRVAT